MAMFRNVMVYLGLGPDDEYDENYLYDEDNVDFDGLERRTVTHRANDGVRIVEDDDDFGVGTVRPLRPVPDSVSVAGERPFGDTRPSGSGVFGSDTPANPMEHPSAGIGAGASSVVTTPESRSAEAGFFGSEDPGSQDPGLRGPGQSTVSQQGGQQRPGASGQQRGGATPIAGDQQRPDTLRSGSPTQGDIGRPSGIDPNQTGGSLTRPHNERPSVAMDDFSQTQGVRGAKPRSVTPRSFDDAKNVANEYQAGSPVVMNLRETDKDTGRRLLDFSSGMVYGLGGGMEKLAANVFLITPDGVEVSADDRRRLEERGYGR